MRNLEQIHEDEGNQAPLLAKGLLTVALLASAVAVGMLLKGRSSADEAKVPDPLAELANKASAAPKELLPKDVSFPKMLSDDPNPSSVYAAVRPRSSAAEAMIDPPLLPPPATDRLTVVNALPAREVLEASPVVTKPRDAMTKIAADSAQVPAATGPLTDSGHEGGYQLQVSSFRDSNEAQNFSEQLRARGHKAHVIEAKVGGRGTWYRVRVGPFASQHAAAQYRSQFEQKEHVVPFIVQPVSSSGKK